MTMYRSGIHRVRAERTGRCADCPRTVTHRREFVAIDAQQLAERWKAETIRCAEHARAHMRRLAGVR